ncbi:zinc knuckle CX2CX4HX4C containing protein [Tanacetum coccineum]
MDKPKPSKPCSDSVLLHSTIQRVKANMDANDIEYFEQMLEHGSTYRISDFNYLETSRWQQTIEKETKGFPEHYFSFVSYNQLEYMVVPPDQRNKRKVSKDMNVQLQLSATSDLGIGSVKNGGGSLCNRSICVGGFEVVQTAVSINTKKKLAPNSKFLDPGGGIGTKKKSNVTGMSGSSCIGQVADVNVFSSDTPKATIDLGNDSNPIEVGHESAMKLPLVLVHEVSDKVENSLCGYFIGKRLAFPVMEWDGLWMIRGVPIFHNKWSPSMSLLKEELSHVPIWVKFHDVLLVVYTSDRLSFIATKIGTPMMLDSYTNSMCLESWGGRSYPRILIEIDACNGFSDNLIMVFLELEGPGYTKETIQANPKKASSVRKSSNKTDIMNATTSGNGIFSLSNSFEALNDDDSVTMEVKSGNKSSTSGVQEDGNSSTHLVEKIHRFEQQLLDGKCVLVDEDGKHMEKVDYSGDHGSEDEVEPDDNEMASFLASKPSGVGYGTKSLLK